jgi:CSLREA domain-containing protein
MIVPIVRLLALLVVASSGLVGPAWSGAPFTVTRTDDPPPDGCAPGDCSLREAVVAANAAAGPDQVTLPPGTYTLSIPPDVTPNDGLDGDLDVFSGGLDILGDGAGLTVIDADGTDRVFSNTDPAGVIRITDVTIRGGSPPPGVAGGGAILNGGTLTFERVWITDNESTDQDGGGIANSGLMAVVNVVDSALTGNRASNSGGGDGGALTNLNGATANLTNATVSGNFANQSGGAIDNSAGSTITLTNSTVTNNTAAPDAQTPLGAGGGGISTTGGTVTLRNTILAGNTDGDPSNGVNPDCDGTISSAGNNLVQVHDSPFCVFAPGVGDRTGVDALVGPLADNGGPTMTHALLPGSPAIDGGGSCGPADQRGAPRSGPCDIGAYELVTCGAVAVNRIGTEGDDTITGTDGADGVLALGGSDTISTGAGNDAACGGEGDDVVDLGPGNDIGLGEAGADRLLGLAGRDLLRGGTENDRLAGGAHKDRLFGDAGKDRLNGGPGKDRCKGGPGKDRNRRCERGKP